MRTPNLQSASFSRPFFGGILAGLAFAGVALVMFEAVRRVRARSLGKRGFVSAIDGVRPLAEAELGAIPTREANSIAHRVESDIEEPPAMSQRW